MPTSSRLAHPLQPPSARERVALATASSAAAPGGRCYGYARVSTSMQVEDGESLDVQQRQIEGYVHMQGLGLTRLFVERGVSGTKPLADRPEGAKLLATLEPGDVLVAPQIDRLFRSALDAQKELRGLHERGIELHIIGLGLGNVLTNSHAKMVFGILAAVAEGERDRIRERITEVKRDQRARGRFLGGGAPFGWCVSEGKTLEPVPEQQDAIRRMKRLRAQGRSLMAISADMKARGISLSHMGVKRTLAAADRRMA